MYIYILNKNISFTKQCFLFLHVTHTDIFSILYFKFFKNADLGPPNRIHNPLMD